MRVYLLGGDNSFLAKTSLAAPTTILQQFTLVLENLLLVKIKEMTSEL